MLAFNVSRNGQRLAAAGLGGFGVVSTILTWVRRTDDATQYLPDLELRVGGMEGDDHLDWVNTDLQVGDVITIELREQDAVDVPVRRTMKQAGTDDVSLIREQIRQMESRLSALRGALALHEREPEDRP